MDLSIFKLGGWNSLQPSNQNLLEKFIDESEQWLLIGIPNRDQFLVTQYLERHFVSSDQHMKELMPLRECLHVTTQCYLRQHFAHRYWLHEHPVGHASWRTYDEEIHKRINCLLCVRLLCRWNVQKMRSEATEHVGKQLVSLQTVGKSK